LLTEKGVIQYTLIDLGKISTGETTSRVLCPVLASPVRKTWT